MSLMFDFSAVQPYMRFYKPLPSAQGMAVWQDRAYILYDTGVCAVYDLATRDPRPLSVFPLGSYNNGKPTRDSLNHANSCMFGTTVPSDGALPLLYVTAGTGIGADEDGFYYRLCVERVEDHGDHHTARLLQTITYQPSAEAKTSYAPPCWGCPAFMVDEAAGTLYIFSARYRTKRGCVPEGERNAYIITRFDLPPLSAGPMVRLTAGDIRDQFQVPSDVAFTQGGQLADGILYYTFGVPKNDYPIHIMAFDVNEKRLLWQADGLDDAFNQEEIECCDLYQGQLLCNTNNGGLYLLPLPERKDLD